MPAHRAACVANAACTYYVLNTDGGCVAARRELRARRTFCVVHVGSVCARLQVIAAAGHQQAWVVSGNGDFVPLCSTRTYLA